MSAFDRQTDGWTEGLKGLALHYMQLHGKKEITEFRKSSVTEYHLATFNEEYRSTVDQLLKCNYRVLLKCSSVTTFRVVENVIHVSAIL